MNRPPLFPDLHARVQLPELMDDPNADQELLENTLRQFTAINRYFTRTRDILKRTVVQSMRENPGRDYHLLDLGAGACDTTRWLLEYAHRHRLRLTVTACDHDPRVIDYARRHNPEVTGLNVVQHDVAAVGDLPPADFVFANHLLHHLTNGEIRDLLANLAKLKACCVVISDIARRRHVYIGYYLLTTVLFRKSFARCDGLLSIRKGFRVPELQQLATEAAGLDRRITVRRMFPGRVVMTMER